MDFIILNVNGKDLSKATHEEAVEAFKNAQEPIIVQVMRRSACTAKNGSTTPNGQGGVPGPIERTVCSVGTQTELQSEDLLWKVLQRCSLPPSDKNCDGGLDGLCDLDPEDPLSVLDSELLQKLEAMEGNLDLPILDEEDCLDRAYEMEYEDIVLKRANTDEKLGLTLCYGSEEDSGIFISEIDPNSIAYDDGRLKEGDQILQINGEDVINKDQALSLFSLQTPCTSLLVCRPQLRFEDCLYEGNALLDDLQMDMLEQTHQEAMQFTACLLHSEGRPDDDGTTDTGTTNTSNHLEKDSGVGRATDESTRHDESSEQEILVDDASMNQKFPVDTTSLGSGGDLRYSNDSFTSNSTAEHDFMGHDISVEECMKFQAALESKCDNKHLRSDTDESMRGKETKVMRLGSDSMDTTSQSGDSLNRPCRNRLICDQQDELQKERRINGHDVWLSNHSQDEQLDTIPCQCPSSESSQKVDKPEKDNSHQRQDDLSPDAKEEANKENGLPTNERQHRRSGSGSGRSHRAPRTVPGSPGGRSKSSSSSRDRSKSTSSSGSTKGSSKDKHSSPSKIASTNTAESNHKHQQTQQQQQQQDNLGQLPGATPYPRRPATNPHLRAQFSQRSPYFMQHDSTRTNLLKHNWKVQQQASQLRKSFDKYGSIQSLQSVPGYAKHYRSYLHLINQNEENAMKSQQQNNSPRNVEGQWKVKIRSDGTRYITKRSSRDRLLKERATKIQEERAGMTTDDEAVSEMKLGKYWNKEDRKRHLERARDQRLRREYMQQARMECLQELEEDGIMSGGGGKREPDIVELSHRKLNKKKGRKMMLDDFTTVQEMLIHGSKVSPDTAKEFSPILNVTMV